MAAKRDDTTPPPGYLFKRLRLKSLDDIYQAMAKLTRLSAMGKVSTERYRSTIYGLHLLINALKEKRSEEPGEEMGGQPLAYFYGFPDETQKFLYSFYSAFWWVPHLLDHPKEEGEAWNAYMNRLRKETGCTSDSTHIDGLKFTPLTDQADINRLCEILSEVDIESIGL